MVGVPGDTPVITPVGLAVAIPPVAGLHDPPGTASLKEVLRPTHTEVIPVIGAGTVLMVTVVVVLHPVDIE